MPRFGSVSTFLPSDSEALDLQLVRVLASLCCQSLCDPERVAPITISLCALLARELLDLLHIAMYVRKYPSSKSETNLRLLYRNGSGKLDG